MRRKYIVTNVLVLSFFAVFPPIYVFFAFNSFFPKASSVSRLFNIHRDQFNFMKHVAQENVALPTRCVRNESNLREKINISLEISKQNYATLSNQFSRYLRRRKDGWQFFPHDCIAHYTIAIIIPIRNRDEHLRIFLGHFHPIIQKHKLRLVMISVLQYYESWNLSIVSSVAGDEGRHPKTVYRHAFQWSIRSAVLSRYLNQNYA